MTLSIEKNSEEVASIFHALKTVPPDATKFKQKLAVEFNKTFGPIFKLYQQYSSDKTKPGDKLASKLKDIDSKIANLSSMRAPSSTTGASFSMFGASPVPPSTPAGGMSFVE